MDDNFNIYTRHATNDQNGDTATINFTIGVHVDEIAQPRLQT